MKNKKLLAITSLLFTFYVQAFVTVGNDVNCDFNTNTLNATILANDEIRLTNQQTIQSFVLNDSDLKIIGGYNNCLDAQNNTLSLNPTVISGNNNSRVIFINNFTNNSTIELSHLELKDGAAEGGACAFIKGDVTVKIEDVEVKNCVSNSSGGGFFIYNGATVTMNQLNIHNNSSDSFNGGGIYIGKNSSLLLRNSQISFNQAQYGAGISVSSVEDTFNNTSVIIENTEISTNESSFGGGGIFCSGQNALTINQSTSIDSNTAQVGGGIYSEGACFITSKAGDNSSSINLIQYGINNNTAFTGSGLYAATGSQIALLGSENHFANMTKNLGVDGTAIFASNVNTSIKILNGRISQNQGDGSALYLTDSAKLEMHRSSGICFGNQTCSEISGNRATSPNRAIIEAFNCSTISVNQTLLYSNQTDNSNLVQLEGNSQDVCKSTFEGNVIYENISIASLFKLIDKYQLDTAFNTITANSSLASVFKLTNFDGEMNSLSINSSIIWNSPAAIIDESNTHNYSGSCNNMHTTSLPNGFSGLLLNLDPFFSNAGNNVYTTGNAQLVNRCDDSQYQASHHDTVGKFRGSYYNAAANSITPYDIGAYEFQLFNPTEIIFHHGFDF